MAGSGQAYHCMSLNGGCCGGFSYFVMVCILFKQMNQWSIILSDFGTDYALANVWVLKARQFSMDMLIIYLVVGCCMHGVIQTATQKMVAKQVMEQAGDAQVYN